MAEADFVVVGGGSAGCVLAARLSEDPRTRVLLIEAGGDGKGWKVDLPMGSIFLMGNPKYDWCYSAVPDASLGGRTIRWPAGRMLGGGSAINGQLYVRGTRGDFDRWVAEGCAGWSFDELLPYFRKSEHFEGDVVPPSHGTEGPQSVSWPRWTHPLTGAFLQGFQELGLPLLDDYCNGEQLGVFPIMGTHRRGQRCSTAKAYIEPVRHRPNLTIWLNTCVRRLILADGRATGVEVLRDGEVATVGVGAEAIVAAGAIGSPALLLRSGIGPAADLSALGIPLQADLRGVGRNLQEHPAVLMARRVNVPTLNSRRGVLHGLGVGLNYLLRKQGPLTTLPGSALAFAKTREDLAEPDVQYHFSPALYGLEADGTPVLERLPGIQIAVNVCRPHGRGTIRIADPTPDSRPVIDHQAFGDSRDLDTLIAGCKLGDRVFEASAFKKIMGRRFAPAEAPKSDDEWAAFIRQRGHYSYHPVGTCRMGVGPESVVDPNLRVRGLRSLRVADASVMPSLVSANTNAATIMIAEKAADLIKQAHRQGGC